MIYFNVELDSTLRNVQHTVTLKYINERVQKIYLIRRLCYSLKELQKNYSWYYQVIIPWIVCTAISPFRSYFFCCNSTVRFMNSLPLHGEILKIFYLHLQCAMSEENFDYPSLWKQRIILENINTGDNFTYFAPREICNKFMKHIVYKT